METVERWFGEGFKHLHPLLQRLHRQGGTLHGPVDLHTGTGLAGWFGARLATRLGIPTDKKQLDLFVTIHSRNDALHWNRRFGDGAYLCSTFHPCGSWPDGYWIESTGAMRLALAVETTDRGWRWRPLKAWLHGMRIPLWLLPRTTAYKRIENDHYHFYVGFSLPVLGTLLSYSGNLSAD